MSYLQLAAVTQEAIEATGSRHEAAAEVTMRATSFDALPSELQLSVVEKLTYHGLKCLE